MGGFWDLAQHGDAVALIEGDTSVTYAELDALVAAAADGLGPRRLAVVPAANTIQFVVAYLAALRARHPVLFTEAYDPDANHELHPDLALLLSTSGSTGTAKMVRLSYDNITSNAAAIVEALGITAEDRAITTLPMHYCYGLSVLHSYLHAGASLVLTDLSVVDRCFWDLARRHDVTSFAGVPHTFELLERVGFTGRELPTLRYVTQAGGRMPPERVQRFASLGFDLVVMYGQTEATARMAYLPAALAATHPSVIGRAIPGGDLRLDDGELVYRGPNVMLGYATAAADLARGRDIDELRTGDLARETSDGLFEIVGRKSRFIKPFGVRVDLDDLERVLAVDGIDALCTGDDHQLVVGVVGVVARTRNETVVADVCERLHLPRSHVAVVELDSVPRLANGKPDYAAVQAQAATANGAASATSIRAAFRVILGVDPRADDTFVGLGGDSLSFVEMSISLEDCLGVLPDDWHTMRFAELEALAPQPRAAKARVDTTLVVRAVAILLIVANHSGLWKLQGGAHALIAVAGFNFARFQLTARSILPSAARIAVPSVLWIGAVSLFSAKYDWHHVLLVNDVLGRREALWSFWFIEAIVQISLAAAVVFAVPAISRAERKRPLAVAYAALALGLCLRFDLLPPPAAHRVTWPHEVFWLFALGWLAARAPSPLHRVAVTAITVLAMPGFFADDVRGFVVAVGILVITWVPAVRVPRPAVRLMTPLAGASLYIYLTHLQLHGVIERTFGSVAATIGSLAVGIATWRVAQFAERALSERQWRFGRVARTRKATGITLTSSNANAGSAAAS